MNANDCIFQMSVGQGDAIPIPHFDEAKHFLIVMKDNRYGVSITRRHNASSSKREQKRKWNE